MLSLNRQSDPARELQKQRLLREECSEKGWHHLQRTAIISLLPRQYTTRALRFHNAHTNSDFGAVTVSAAVVVIMQVAEVERTQRGQPQPC